MPKSKARKKASVQRQSLRPLSTDGTQGAVSARTQETLRRPLQGAADVQGLVMPAMVALGCWGLAAFFMVFSADPNHVIWAGFALLMGLMWSLSFWFRLRRMRRRK